MLGKEADNSQSTAYDIYIVGEQIRSQLYRQVIIKDRRYRLRKYKKCFVGANTVDWLVTMCHAHSRGEAVMAMRVLQEYGMLHHVLDEHVFKDQSLFYRFTKDDGTYQLRADLTAFYKGLDVFTKVKESSIRRDFYHRGHLYQGAFYGCDLVDILVTPLGDGKDHRADVIARCRDLLEYDIIRHVTSDYHFSDDRLMYQFAVDYDRPCLLLDVLHHPSASIAISTTDMRPQPRSPAVPASGTTHSPTAPRTSSSVDPQADGSNVDNQTAHDTSSDSRSDNDSENSGSEFGTLPSLGLTGKGDAVVTMVKKVVKLHQDEVGYGFVLRGDSPCHIHTIDPLGPAAAAGLREGQYVLSVAGQNVKQKDHRYVGQLVMTSVGYLTISVLTRTLQHLDNSPRMTSGPVLQKY